MRFVSSHRSPVFLLACLATGAANGAAVLIDDGDPGHSQTGSWSSQATPNGHSGDWRYQNSAGGSDTATYDFTGLASGNYVVARSSFTQANLSGAATYSVSDGGGTYTQSQQVAVRNLDLDGSVGFQRLSNFSGYAPVNVTDGSLSITVGDTDNAGFLIADAVRIEQVRDDVQKIHVTGNGDAGYAESSGTWAGFNEIGDHAGGFRYGSGTLSDQITISFAGLDSGIYRISSSWTGGANRSSGVTLSYATTGAAGNLSYSQVPGAAADDLFENVKWQDMFAGVNVTDGTLTLTLQNNSPGGLMIADGFRLELIPEPSSTLLGGLGALLVLRRRRAVG